MSRSFFPGPRGEPSRWRKIPPDSGCSPGPHGPQLQKRSGAGSRPEPNRPTSVCGTASESRAGSAAAPTGTRLRFLRARVRGSSVSSGSKRHADTRRATAPPRGAARAFHLPREFGIKRENVDPLDRGITGGIIILLSGCDVTAKVMNPRFC